MRYHITVDACQCNDKIKSVTDIEDFSEDLFKIISTEDGEVLVQDFKDGVFEGMSMIRHANAALITGFFYDHDSSAHIDISYDKEFKEIEVLEIINTHFQPKDAIVRHMVRQPPR